jgi:hypothetical protein
MRRALGQMLMRWAWILEAVAIELLDRPRDR